MYMKVVTKNILKKNNLFLMKNFRKNLFFHVKTFSIFFSGNIFHAHVDAFH
jgi:hypothetical protein